MLEFKVVRVVDGRTIEVHPQWSWNSITGTMIKVNCLMVPELHQPGGIPAKTRLTDLALHRVITVSQAYGVESGILVCDVYLRGQRLQEFLGIKKTID